MRSASARAVVLLGSLFVLACFAVTATAAVAHETTLRGLVLAGLPARGEIVARYDPAAGVPGGVATFRVVPGAALRELRPGRRFLGTVDVDGSPWTLSAVRVLGTQALASVAEPVPSITRNVHHVVVGEYAPVTTLVDQRGRPFSLRSLRGESVVMAFVYTRCKDVRECPLITARFAALQSKFAGAAVHLVEVTLDPEFDTPAVLARYGARFAADSARWTLATGAPDTVLDFAAQFDVTAFPDTHIGLIHPERLVILDKYGAIRNMIDEGAWTPDEIVAEVRHEERLSSNPFERLDLWLSSAAVAVCGNAVAGFSGFTDLLTVIGIAAFFGFLFWRLGRFIARGAT